MVNLKLIELFRNAYVVFGVTDIHHPHLDPSICQLQMRVPKFCIHDGAFLNSGWAAVFTSRIRLPTSEKDTFMVIKMLSH